MAGGVVDQQGFTAAPADVQDAGELSWAAVSGIDAADPLVSGPGLSSVSALPNEATGHMGFVSLPVEESAAGRAGLPPAFDDWRDLIDFRGSPAPWVLLLAFAAIGWVALGASARVGPASGSIRVGR